MSAYTFAPLTPEQLEALALWVAEHEHQWKTKLAVAWVRGTAPPILHALRNTHGPLWLELVQW